MFYLLGFIFLLSCSSDKAPRIYKEILVRTGAKKISSSKFSYQLPPKWESFPFLASRNSFVSPPILNFRIIKDGRITLGTLTEIEGEAGEVENNVLRWMRQLGMRPMTSKMMQHWLQKQFHFKTKQGYKGIVVDLTTILSGSLNQKEFILASIIQTKKSKIFVKIKGHKQILIQNRPQILDFSRSIQIDQ